MRHILKNIFFSVTVILIFFLTLEGICRSGMALLHRDISFLRYGFVYLSPIESRSFSSTEQEVEDYFGIAVYGGSVAYGWDVEREDAFPKQLEAILNKRLNTNRIMVANRGAPAAISHKNVSDILSEGDDKIDSKNRNRIYIVFIGINDAHRIQTAAEGKMRFQPDEFAFNKFELTKMQRAYFLLKKLSLSFSLMDDFLLGHRIGDKFAGKRIASEIFNTQYTLPIKAVDQEAQVQLLLNRYRDNLMTIINFCRLYGIHLIFGREAVYEKYGGNKWPSGQFEGFMKYYNLTYEEMERIARKENIIYVDTNSYFAKLPNTERFFLYDDWCHHTPEGNRLVAELLADTIIKNNLIKK